MSWLRLIERGGALIISKGKPFGMAALRQIAIAYGITEALDALEDGRIADCWKFISENEDAKKALGPALKESGGFMTPQIEENLRSAAADRGLDPDALKEERLNRQLNRIRLELGSIMSLRDFARLVKALELAEDSGLTGDELQLYERSRK